MPSAKVLGTAISLCFPYQISVLLLYCDTALDGNLCPKCFLNIALFFCIIQMIKTPIEHYGTTASVNHLTCPLPPHQSAFDLPTATTSSVSASPSTRDRASTSARHRALPYHRISQSFDLSPATTSVSHLTCPLPPHHQSELALALALEIELVLALDIEHDCITTSVNHLTCPLPPHQSVIWLAHCHHIISHLTCPLPPHHQSELALVLALEIELVLALDIEHYYVTASVNHLTCPLPPHQSVIWLALYHYITRLVSYLTCPHLHISQSFDLPPAANQAVIWFACCHHIIMSPPPLALALVLALGS